VLFSYFKVKKKENREVGENPTRAQRCKGDYFCEIPLKFSFSGRCKNKVTLSQKTGLFVLRLSGQ